MNREFACTHTSIEGDPSAGQSLKHPPNDPPGLCGRGAGRQNVQTVFMTPRNEILHVVTGYLDTPDLLEEMQVAKEMYRQLPASRAQQRQAVVAMHARRLQRLGFTQREIAARNDATSEMMATMFSPQDLGLNLGSMAPAGRGQHGNMFTAMNRQRVLKDHRFVMQNPLIDRDAFDVAPQALVGHHKSFFGSVGGPQTQMIQNVNGMLGNR